MNTVEKTILVTGPKRAGKTLLLRLFDHQPDVLHFIDEAFFWEHAFNYQEAGMEDQFIDMFKTFKSEDLYEAMLERDILPALNGKFRQFNPIGSEQRFKYIDTGLSVQTFIEGLNGLVDCTTIAEIWNVLCCAYGSALYHQVGQRRIAFMMSGDSGKSLIAAEKSLPQCRCIFIVRDPYLALDSLKMSRQLRGEKVLNPINFSKVVSYYSFIMKNIERILHKNTFLIRYEDLVANLAISMRQIANHCGIELTENLLHPTLMGESWGTNSVFRDGMGVDYTSVSRDISVLSRSETQYISRHVAPFLEYFGYPRR